MRTPFILLVALISLNDFAVAQTLTSKENPLFTPPEMYAALYTSEQIKIDGSLAENAWQQTAWSNYFTDIEGTIRPQPFLRTRMKLLWGDSCLYVAAELEEPHIQATLLRHDAVIFQDNDFEVFIDPYHTTHNYYEIEVNAFNTIFDLMLPKPYRNGGSALIGYNVEGLQSAVLINGTLNHPEDKDSGWCVEIAIPYQALTLGNDVHVPKTGELWRINFSRVEWDTEIKAGQYSKKKDAAGQTLPEHNWVWSPQGVVNMHYPERWGYVQFCKINTVMQRPANEPQRNQLWLLYYRQKGWQKTHGQYCKTLSGLGIPANRISFEATGNQFLAGIQLPDGSLLTINQDGFISLSASKNQ